MNKNKNIFKSKKILIVGIVSIALLVFFFSRGLFGDSQTTSAATQTNASEVVDVNKIFPFQARDDQQGVTEQIVELAFVNVQLKDEVLIKGQRAQARNEKTFLVFDILVRNDTNDVLYLNPVDLVRWAEAEDILVAPQVTQGNLEVRPQSTKKSNLGFVVPTDTNDFVFQIGELEGEKQQFEVKIPR